MLRLIDIKKFIFNRSDCTPASRNMAAADDPQRLLGCRLIERSRNRSPPVNKKGRGVFIEKRDSTDVVGRVVLHIEAPEY